MLKKFQMEYCKPVTTPMIIGSKVNDEYEYKEVDQRLYRSMISSMLYVTASRPNVIQEDIGGHPAIPLGPPPLFLLVFQLP